jgi:hypothetical protein
MDRNAIHVTQPGTRRSLSRRLVALSLLACLLCGYLLRIDHLSTQVRLPPFVLDFGPSTQLRGSRIEWSCADFPSPQCNQPFYAVDLIWANRTGYQVVTFIELPLPQQ